MPGTAESQLATTSSSTAAGQLDTDLNRDILWRHMQKKGLSGVRQVAIDEVWSAMRFRPKGG